VIYYYSSQADIALFAFHELEVLGGIAMWLTVVRDVAIVLLALESVVVGVLLALTLAQVRNLVRLLREEIAPMLTSAGETMNTVNGTATFVSKTVVTPLIKATSYSTGTLQALRSLLFIRRKVGGHASDEGGDGSSAS